MKEKREKKEKKEKEGDSSPSSPVAAGASTTANNLGKTDFIQPEKVTPRLDTSK